MNNLISVTVYLDNSMKYSTNVNGACSDEEINRYFIGNSFNIGSYSEDKTARCLRIEINRETEKEN